MRRFWIVAVALVLAGSAHAQTFWLGAGVSTSWEYKPSSSPDSTWLHSSSPMPHLFVGVPLSDESLLRLRAFDLPHEVLIEGVRRDSRLRGITASVDYLFASSLGQSVFSAGFGGYQLDLEQSFPGNTLEGWKFGWFVGIGEWFTVTRRGRVTVELTMHRTEHEGTPMMVAATAGFAVAF